MKKFTFIIVFSFGVIFSCSHIQKTNNNSSDMARICWENVDTGYIACGDPMPREQVEKFVESLNKRSDSGSVMYIELEKRGLAFPTQFVYYVE